MGIMDSQILQSMNEKQLQEYVHIILSDPATIRTTSEGNRLQILSPGQLNPFEGPDLKDIAILLGGSVILGDAEFHINASDWDAHRHSVDERYRNVILHIVINNNKELKQITFNTLVISAEEIESVIKSSVTPDESTDTASLEYIQHYALIRLLRKSAYAQEQINSHGYRKAVHLTIAEFLEKYNQRRKRPVYSLENLDDLMKNLDTSNIISFLNDLENSETTALHDKLFSLMKAKIFNEGPHLRREIILNCILPLAICIASEESRISLFLWYWSTPALNKYGLLSRKFSNIPQNFLWEQQGMLEFIKEHGRKINVIKEALHSYGFAEILSFYRLGNPPFNKNDYEVDN
jgi:hypothetical protein